MYLFFNEGSLVWHTDDFGLLLLWWWVAALYGACFHSVVFCCNLNSDGPIYTSVENFCPHSEKCFEWIVCVSFFFFSKNPITLFMINEWFSFKITEKWLYCNNTKPLLWARQYQNNSLMCRWQYPFICQYVCVTQCTGAQKGWCMDQIIKKEIK